MHDREYADALVKGLAFLTSLGFSATGCTQTVSETLGPSWQVVYAAPTLQREVAGTYYPDRDFAMVSIRDTSEQLSFNDAGAMYIRSPAYSDIAGNGLQRLQKYLQRLEESLLVGHRSELLGSPVRNDTFDWSPYK
jgi:hypothetical protein